MDHRRPQISHCEVTSQMGPIECTDQGFLRCESRAHEATILNGLNMCYIHNVWEAFRFSENMTHFSGRFCFQHLYCQCFILLGSFHVAESAALPQPDILLLFQGILLFAHVAHGNTNDQVASTVLPPSSTRCAHAFWLLVDPPIFSSLYLYPFSETATFAFQYQYQYQ